MSDLSTAVLADLHLEPENEGMLFDAVDTTLQRIQSLSPDQLVILGDIVQETSAPVDRRLIETFVDRLTEIDVPFRCLLGNHDIVEITPRIYTEVVGNDAYGVVGNYVFLNSASPHLSHSRGEISDEQLNFLKDVLASLNSVIVFVHHPIHYHDVSDNRWFSDTPEGAFCGNKEEVLDILKSSPTEITAVINGHLHEWNHSEYRGIDHFTIDSFNKILESEQETGGFGLIEDGEQLRVTQYNADGSERSVLLP